MDKLRFLKTLFVLVVVLPMLQLTINVAIAESDDKGGNESDEESASIEGSIFVYLVILACILAFVIPIKMEERKERHSYFQESTYTETRPRERRDNDPTPVDDNYRITQDESMTKRIDDVDLEEWP